MLQALLIFIAIALVYCLWLAVAFLLALTRESQMPDTDDVEIVEKTTVI